MEIFCFNPLVEGRLHMDFFKKIGLVVVYFSAIFLVFYVINLCDRLDKFERYRCEDGGFTVLLPGEPQEQLEHFHALFWGFDYNTIRAGSRQSKFMVMYFNKSMLGQQKKTILDLMKAFAIAVTHGRLVEESDGQYRGYPAKDFELSILGRKTVKARAIAVGKWCYQLMVVSSSKKVLEEKVPEFFESFEIDEPE